MHISLAWEAAWSDIVSFGLNQSQRQVEGGEVSDVMWCEANNWSEIDRSIRNACYEIGESRCVACSECMVCAYVVCMYVGACNAVGDKGNTVETGCRDPEQECERICTWDCAERRRRIWEAMSEGCILRRCWSCVHAPTYIYGYRLFQIKFRDIDKDWGMEHDWWDRIVA